MFLNPPHPNPLRPKSDISDFGIQECRTRVDRVRLGRGTAPSLPHARHLTWELPLIRTVTGDVERIKGRILAHEHLQIDLSAQKGPANKVGEAEIPAVVEDLRIAKEFGLAAITDLSAPFWGRDPAALRRISEASGVKVVCAAGFYWDPFPEVAEKASVEAIRDAMIAEIEIGADGTDVCCGVIKV